MILYFSGTGNSLAIARRIADATSNQTMLLADAARQDIKLKDLLKR